MEISVRTPAVEPRAMWSHSCTLDDLVTPYAVDPTVVARLEAGPGWARRWTAVWRASRARVVCPVPDLADFPTLASAPVRSFTWQARQRHRPGLQFVLATSRMHGFESLEERRLLLALDFTGGIEEVLSQPFKLRFTAIGGGEDHTPDFLVLLNGTAVLIDVRPGHRVKDKDLVKFAAAERAAASAGWRYLVVTGWRRHVAAGLDALSARRRPMADRLGLHDELLEMVAERPRRFGDLVEATSLPAVARAHAVHLL
ncbi:TnsA-like heteromeric transposase endonuclease subunit [Streptomyces sp. XD-27]|uniref:TnsA-like heteromeric transposase endonuclease subunit n=1 Tax=Streptomyces sp. XD-27 TaxID=3062779 RepID=UPI0026F425BB|nr:TnsA-like heteromeric transposase endonuclease subunit [Streptomyces sp. XD-27]WKX73830.1 TnsA-like heteromeric transposase endonuclease subunit [Streptomyces sp. XD-27]